MGRVAAVAPATARARPDEVQVVPAHDAERASPLVVGVVVWLASEVMFFGGLFAAWFVLKAHNEPNWPPSGEELELARTAVFTAVLLASSLTIHQAVAAAEKGRRSIALRWLAVTIVMGGTFLANEALEWSALPFGFDSSAFSSIYYLLTGFHGLHVLGGLVLMSCVAWVVFSPGSRAPSGEAMRCVGYYWHFVDVVWALLFVVVYVLR